MNIDYTLTEKAFRQLGVTNFNEFYTQHHASSLFEDFETGKISPEIFCDELRNKTGVSLTNEQIYWAWNAMLLDFPLKRLDWLEEIKKRYKIFLYSNTNKIHYDAFIKIVEKATGNNSFNNYFLKAYYSHYFGLRKPYATSYTAILEEQKIKAEETLFIDDTIKNIEGAKMAGLQTIHLKAPQTVLDLHL